MLHAFSESQDSVSTRISGHWLWIARIVLLVINVLVVVMYIVGIPANLAWFNSYHSDCLDVCMTAATAQSLRALGIPITAFAIYWTVVNLLFAFTYFVVAALIFWRKSDDRIAWLASFFLLTLGAAFPSIPAALADVYPAWRLPVAIIGNEDLFGFPALIFFLFLFPDGRFIPRWTRWAAIAFAIVFMLAGIFPYSSVRFTTWAGPLVGLAPLVIFGSLVYAQVYRYRRVSTPVERQQTKWIVFGTTIALLGFLLLGYLLEAVLTVFFSLQSVSLLPRTIAVTCIYLILLLIPLSFAVAIGRYRLWDVDILINKTLVYGGLSAILIAIYALSITVLQAFLNGLFHQTSQIAIVASTLVIVALSQPLRAYLQALIDRRFYRRKYDAAQMLAAFGSSLHGEVDLSRLSENLVAVVQETMQPTHISLWLRPSTSPQNHNTQALPHFNGNESETAEPS